MPHQIVTPVIDPAVRCLCYRPYHGHPKGCPNYGKRKTCPPHASFFDNIIDREYPIYVIWDVFPLATHVARMKILHPGWSQRQAACCLYWQGRARRILDINISYWQGRHQELRGEYIISKCPEAMGVNVTATMKLIGEELEWPPVTKTYQVAIAGRARRG